MKAFGSTYAYDLKFDTAGAPNGVENVEQSFSQGVLNTVMSPFTGGTSGAVGLGHTAGEAIKMVAGHVVCDLVEDKFDINLNPVK